MFGVGVGIRVGGFTPISGGGAPYVGLLDTYPNAAAAYSVRLLKSDYTGNAIRVRRASDNTEQNIGFTALGNLDTTALTTFCGAGNGFVTTWYDQSGNGYNATQTTAANQPQIVSSGSVITLNSKPSLQSATTLKTLLASNISYNECYISVVFNRTGKISDDTLYSFFNSPYNQLYTSSSNWGYYSQSTLYNTTIPLSTSQKLITQIDNGSNTLFYDNNTLDSTFNASNNISNITLTLLGYGSYGSLGNMQEFVLYSSDQTTNRAGINANINTYYGIY